MFAVAFLGAALPAAAGIAAFLAGPVAGVVAATVFVLPLLYAVPGDRALWVRHRNWLLAAQALLTYLPLARYGGDWVPGLTGLLGGLLLLTVPAPASWLLFGAALATEAVLRFAVVGLPDLLTGSDAAFLFVLSVYVAVAVFGLVRLAGLVTDLHAARTELARLAVARERLRADERLRAAVGSRLDAVTAAARAALVALAREPDEARVRLAEAAGSARQALDDVREMVAQDRREPWPDAGTGQRPDAEPTLAPKLARIVLVLVLVTMSAQLVVDAFVSHVAAWVTVASVAGIVALVALQLYHSTAWRERTRPRGWRWTLGAMLLLTALGFFPVLHPAIHGLGGFVAGSALLLLSGRWGWAAFVGVQVAIAIHVVVLPGGDATDLIYTLVGTVTTGLVVYGLSRLTGLAVEYDEARRELARLAVVRERMRVARNTHDLLGLGLSAVALKCDLAGRLVGRDDAKARDEIDALLRLAVQSRAEFRSVTSDWHRLSLPAELDGARDVLASAGIAVDLRDQLPAIAPEEVETVLATVLREAVTNVLRHTAATWCEIELTSAKGGVRLRVANDGVPGTPGDAPARDRRSRAGGHGLANLSARAETLGGRLSTTVDGGRFELIVEIPLTAPSPEPVPLRRSPQPADEHALAANGQTQGAAIDGKVVDQEP